MAKPLTRRLKRPSDPIMLGKLIGDIATGQVRDEAPPAPTANDVRRVMSMLGKIGGPKGGKARAKALSKRERRLIAQKAAKARWKGKLKKK